MARQSRVKESLSQTEARHIALNAQSLAGAVTNPAPSAKSPVWASLAKTINRLHLLQMDSVNVLARAHYLPLFSRHGAYEPQLLDQAAYGPNRQLFECWAHEASLVPLPLHPLMRWRMDRALRGDSTYGAMARLAREEPSFVKNTLAFVKQNGPTRAADLTDGGKARGGWWGWSKGKPALETLFDQGLLTTSARPGFERIYDLTERVIPGEILNLRTPNEAEIFRELMKRASTALGIATLSDLRDYFRLPLSEAKHALTELVEAGELQQVTVAGWKQLAYIPKKLTSAKTPERHTLLSPFDPLIWQRQRTERLFNFHYRLEIYTPAEKRRYGYYVLPFLMGDQLVARCCLKADRQTSTLRLNASHYEPDHSPDDIASPLQTTLKELQHWLGLEKLSISPKGNLAKTLRRMT